MPPSPKPVNVIWNPQQGPQHAFFLCEAFELLYGGGAGGGKSEALIVQAAAFCIKFPNYKAILFRRTFPEIQKSLVPRVSEYISSAAKSRNQGLEWRFQNGSVLYLSHLQREDDKEKHKSTEYDFIGFDELTSFTETQYQYLFSRCRGTAQVPRMIRSGSNPSGAGNGWVRARFVDFPTNMDGSPKDLVPEGDPVKYDYAYGWKVRGQIGGSAIITNFSMLPENFQYGEPAFEERTYQIWKDKKSGVTRAFIPALLWGNAKLLKGDPEYVSRVRSLDQKQQDALLYGRWDSFEGAFFPEWDPDVHVVDGFEIPPSWKRFVGIDYGYSAPFCAIWFAVDNDGTIYCVAPETKILTSDLRWVEAGTVKVGDVLAGFDEETPSTSRKRRWKESTVEAVERIMQPAYRLTLSDGTVVTCSSNHLWLIETAGTRKQWKRTEDLTITDRFSKVLDVWDKDISHGSGYLAGAFDGEGSLSFRDGDLMSMSIAQKDNALLKRVKDELNERGFRYGVYKNKSDVLNLTLTRKRDILRFFGSVGPERLVPKFSFNHCGTIHSFSTPHIVKKEFLGTIEVVSMKTSSGTFIAEGLASHNCYRELYASKLLTSEQAAEIADMSRQETIEWYAADPSMFSKSGSGESHAQIYHRLGVPILASSNKRVPRWALMHELLGTKKIKIFRSCTNLIRTIPTFVHAAHNPDDLDSTQEDHAIDALSYGLITLRGYKTQNRYVQEMDGEQLEVPSWFRERVKPHKKILKRVRI